MLASLFGAPHIATRLRAALGFDAAQAIACVEALPKLLRPRVAGWGRHALAERREEALTWAAAVLRDGLPPETAERDEYLTVIWAMAHVGYAMLFTADELAAAADVPATAAARFVQALSTPFGQQIELFAGAEAIRARPYVDAGAGHWYCVVPGSEIWALRGIFEDALKGNAYHQHRGEWLERRAGDMLSAALEPDERHDSVHLVPAGGGNELGEIDVLLRYGDTVLAVEAKGAALKPGARRGGQALIDHLKRHLTKAAERLAARRLDRRGRRRAARRSRARDHP